jgi:hypothetical protein
VAKSRDQLSDAYRKRIERAEARGLTRQQARGHREPHEHRKRAVRERKEQGITGDQLRTVRRYAERRARQNKALDAGDLVDWAKSHGYGQFKAFRAERDALARNYKAERRAGTYKPRTVEQFKAGLASASGAGGGGVGGMGGGGGGGGGDNYRGGDDFTDDGDDVDFDEDFDEDYYDEQDFDYDEDMPIEWMYYHDD